LDLEQREDLDGFFPFSFPFFFFSNFSFFLSLHFQKKAPKKNQPKLASNPNASSQGPQKLVFYSSSNFSAPHQYSSGQSSNYSNQQTSNSNSTSNPNQTKTGPRKQHYTPTSLTDKYDFFFPLFQ